MIRTILVDDEKPALDELTFLLEPFEQIQIMKTFSESTKALEYILLNDVDCIFLDISMPVMDGFMLAEALIKLRRPPHIIFATAYDAYAIDAFKINAIDYLLKPITQERLAITMKRLEAAFKQKLDQVDPIANMLLTRYKDKKTTRLPLWKNDRIHLVNPNHIHFIETNEGITILHTAKGDFIANESLNHYETLLSGYQFFRCHRSYIIHLDHITEIIPWFNNTYAVKVADHEHQIPISRRNAKTFKEMFHL